MATAKFKRGDGAIFIVDEGSAAFDLMSKDGGFTLLREDGSVEEKPELNEVDLSKLTKKQLFETAAAQDVPVTAKMSNAEIIAAIEAKSGDAETE